MPVRLTRPRKNDGLRHYIIKVYTTPILKFLSDCGEGWGPIRDLIYGPTDLHTDPFFNQAVREASFKRLAELEQLWGEVREDILRAQQEYSPNRKPWGCRFD